MLTISPRFCNIHYPDPNPNPHPHPYPNPNPCSRTSRCCTWQRRTRTVSAWWSCSSIMVQTWIIGVRYAHAYFCPQHVHTIKCISTDKHTHIYKLSANEMIKNVNYTYLLHMVLYFISPGKATFCPSRRLWVWRRCYGRLTTGEGRRHSSDLSFQQVLWRRG
jgi:hypothetical protein